MNTLKFLSAGLVAAGMLTTPVFARDHHSSTRYVTEGPDVNVRPMAGYGYTYGQSCAPAPRVGAFATQPWDYGPPCAPYAHSGSSGYSAY